MGNFSEDRLYWYSKGNANDGQARFYAESAAWDDGGVAWHQVTVTYSLATDGNSVVQIYLDGTALTTYTIADNFDSSELANVGDFNEWAVARNVGGKIYGSQGSMDDFAVWRTAHRHAGKGSLRPGHHRCGRREVQRHGR